MLKIRRVRFLAIVVVMFLSGSVGEPAFGQNRPEWFQSLVERSEWFFVTLAATNSTEASFSKDHQDGPFGIELGAPLENYVEGDIHNGTDGYSVVPPKKSTLFEHYTVFGHSEVGVCIVQAITEPIDNDEYGSATRSKFSSVVEILTRKYGTPSSTFDDLRAGSIWDEPNEWMRSLEQKNRTLTAIWISTGDDALTESSLQGIALTAVGLSRTAGVLRLAYESTYRAQCDLLWERQDQEIF